MPTIDISLNDLRKLVGKEFTNEEFENAILWVKGEIENIEGDIVKVDCKESNRPDLWSTEGIARTLRPYFTAQKGIPQYSAHPTTALIHVDRSVDAIRPYIAAATIENVSITEEALKQLIQLQEKICTTFGRKRKIVAIGVYNYDKIELPITYKAVKPTEAQFVPLGFTKELTLRDILKTHPKGIEYGHLLKDVDRYPILIDKKGTILSLPPIINAEDVGKVETGTRTLFIEATGTSIEEVKVAVLIIAAALADRGGSVLSVTINYGEKKIVTPTFATKKIKVTFKEIETLTGLKFSLKELKTYLERFSYNIKKAKDALEIEYPSYRQDILHSIDVIEDLLISYGYNSIEPLTPKLSVQGELAKEEEFAESVRNLLVGFGAQEIMNFTLSNQDVLCKKMNRKEQRLIEIANPVSQQWTTIRDSVLPTILEFLEKNTSQEYPQKIFELGDIVVLDEKAETKTRTEKHLAIVIAEKESTFTKAKQILDYLCCALHLAYDLSEEVNPQFISGRCGHIHINGKHVGIIGEIHPQILENFKLQIPASAFEVDISTIFKMSKA